jgi:hypothetical protein
MRARCDRRRVPIDGLATRPESSDPIARLARTPDGAPLAHGG